MSNLTFSQAIEEIKSKLDIVDVVSKYVVLKKQGVNYTGLCPFHNEKTPSFIVASQKQIYKCFGCGEGGDVFSFLMKINNQSFSEMINEQAQSLGIELSNNYEKVSLDTKKELIKACEEACEFFRKNLEKNPQAYDYLRERGITDDVIKTYKIGFAPKSFDALHESLKNKFTDEQLFNAGLITNREKGGYIDRFRGRITIPIIDEKGNIVAFGARAVEKGQSPKYLNSPDTKIYNKSNILYGLYQAKDAIKNEDACIIMEGYFDVISAQSNGVKNAVASCGTALTPQHIKLISRYTQSRKIYLAFDTDSAGVMATEAGAKAIKEVFSVFGNIKQYDEGYSSGEKSCEIRVVSPPSGKDPDEYIREIGAEAYKEQLKNAPLLLDYQIEQVFKKHNPKTPVEKKKMVVELITLLNEIENTIVQGEYVKLISQRVNVREDAIYPYLKTKNRNTHLGGALLKTNVKNSKNVIQKAQKNFLSLYMVADTPEKLNILNELISGVDFIDENLIKLKNSIDKLIPAVNNVDEFIQKLYNEFTTDEHIKQLITDLVYMSESFSSLNFEDYTAAVRDNRKKIERLYSSKIKADCQKKYHDVDNDEEALKLQIEFKDTLRNNKHTTLEIINND